MFREAHLFDYIKIKNMLIEGLNDKSIVGTIKQNTLVIRNALLFKKYLASRGLSKNIFSCWPFVCCLNKKPIAFSLLVEFEIDTTIVIELLFFQVKREYRGNGIGTQMLTEFENTCRLQNIPLYIRCLESSKTIISILENRNYQILVDQNYGGRKYIKYPVN
jgi:GNAT superfamily N-acetyltransferase